jgi:hypothetical protein
LARLRPEPYTTALTLVLGFLKPTTDPSLIGHIVGANDVHDVPLLVSDFHAEVGFVQFWVVIQKLSRDKRCLLDRGSDIGELVTLVVPRPRSPVEHMKEVAGHRRAPLTGDEALAAGLTKKKKTCSIV